MRAGLEPPPGTDNEDSYDPATARDRRFRFEPTEREPTWARDLIAWVWRVVTQVASSWGFRPAGRPEGSAFSCRSR